MIFPVENRGEVVEAFGPIDDTIGPIGAEWCGGRYTAGRVFVPFRYGEPVVAREGTFIIRDTHGRFGVCTSEYLSDTFVGIPPPAESPVLTGRLRPARVKLYPDVDWATVAELVADEIAEARRLAAA